MILGAYSLLCSGVSLSDPGLLFVWQVAFLLYSISPVLMIFFQFQHSAMFSKAEKVNKMKLNRKAKLGQLFLS